MAILKGEIFKPSENLEFSFVQGHFVVARGGNDAKYDVTLEKVNLNSFILFLLRVDKFI